MEIEVGEYIRNKYGNIGKVLDITHCTGQTRKKYLIKWNISKAYYITSATIKAHSKNIIDLIEVGDLVKIKDNCGAIHWFEVYENSEIYQYDILEIATKEMMKSISYKVTKEQFNQIKYEV